MNTKLLKRLRKECVDCIRVFYISDDTVSIFWNDTEKMTHFWNGDYWRLYISSDKELPTSFPKKSYEKYLKDAIRCHILQEVHYIRRRNELREFEKQVKQAIIRNL